MGNEIVILVQVEKNWVRKFLFSFLIFFFWGFKKGEIRFCKRSPSYTRVKNVVRARVLEFWSWCARERQ